MIADWTVEIGSGCPVIELPWPGWVDLRAGSSPADVETLPEVQSRSELAALLRAANQGSFATAKVDVFPVDRSAADPEIAEQPPEQTAHGLGSYLDVVWLGDGAQPPFAVFEAVARRVSASLRDVPLALGTAEIVIRTAHLYHQGTLEKTPEATMGFHLAVRTAPWASSSIG
jgi:hypothetical protein